MSVKSILTEPNKLLRQISKPVEKVTKEDQKLMDDMLDTMYAANGIGLANSNWCSKKNNSHGYQQGSKQQRAKIFC